MNTIDAAMFKAMIRSGALDLQRHTQEVNNLNVFPVPDGDTGVNMFATISGGVAAIDSIKDEGLGAYCRALSQGMLLAARGNSGVILSQFFAGFCEKLAPFYDANVTLFAQAFNAGVHRAYDVVVKPVEGTILTVMREGGEKAMREIDNATSFEDYFTCLLKHMRMSLAKTPNLLPVLKDAGVIDSGGAGLLYIVEGMAQALGGKMIEDVSLGLSADHDEGFTMTTADVFDADTSFDYGYCTEFILQLTRDKGGVERFNLDEAIEFFSSIGDSLVAFMDGTMVKVHVHTKTPDQVVNYALGYGEMVRFKMENMTLQHNRTLVDKSKNVSMLLRPEREHKSLASIAVVPNMETSDLFKEFGVDQTIVSGKLMNPGVEDFLQAYKKANADDVFVFPNNKNEIMVAEIASGMMESSQIHIIPTADLAEGLACVSIMDTVDLSVEENHSRIEFTLENVNTVSIYQAARDSSVMGSNVKRGDYAYQDADGKMVSSLSLLDLFHQWFDAHDGADASLLYLICDSRVDEDTYASIEAMVIEENPFLEIHRLDCGDLLHTLHAVME